MTTSLDPAAVSDRRCGLARRSAIAGVVACAIAQVAIEATVVNALCVLLSAAASVVTFQVVIRPSVFRAAPLPSLVVLGFNIATMSGALVAQTLSLRPLVFNLRVPELTFAGCALFQGSLLLALLMFVRSIPFPFRPASRLINVRLFQPLRLMEPPRPVQLWLMGSIGLTAMAWSATVAYTGAVQYGDVGAKFVEGLADFVYAPFLIPVVAVAFPAKRQPYRPRFLAVYFCVLLVLGIAFNVRAKFVMGVANLGVAVLLLGLLGQLKVTPRLRRQLVGAALLLLLAAPMLADLATAMVVVRGERGQVSAATLVLMTFEAFADKKRLENYRASTSTLVGNDDYEEYYLSNPFLSRFVQTKFFDNTLALEPVREGRYADALWKITGDKLIAQLPTPVLRFIGSTVDKDELAFSMGDALYYQEYGTDLGHYKTGSPLGHGLALMGSFVYIVAIPLFLVVFFVLQTFTSRAAATVVLSPVILLQSMTIFQLASLDSLLDPVTLVTRTLPQQILIYAVLFRLTALAVRPRVLYQVAVASRPPLTTPHVASPH